MYNLSMEMGRGCLQNYQYTSQACKPVNKSKKKDNLKKKKTTKKP